MVAAHVALHTGTDQNSALLHPLDIIAPYAVMVFVIISGFVITHLLLERNESYFQYITRRFLRIYPLYAVCLTAGVLATRLHFAAFAGHPWGNIVPQPDLVAAEQRSLAEHGYAVHILAHMTLLHGAIPNHLLEVSEYMFLGPAWSLSLEWQFYLVAPFVLWCLGSRGKATLLALATVGAFAACRFSLRGSEFFDPSFLPAATPYFALGIATRLSYHRLPILRTFPFVPLILAGGFVIISRDLLPCLVWLCFVAWMRLQQPQDRMSAVLDHMLNAAFNSGPARRLGRCSYSTYLIHEPLIHSIVYVCIIHWGLGMWPTFQVVALFAPAITLAASLLLYRWIEIPAIDFGKRLFTANTSLVDVPYPGLGAAAIPAALPPAKDVDG